jgi:putative phosphoribosyl transferase
MEIVPGAAHLFEEPGVLDEVACLASDWFAKYVRRAALSLVATGPQPTG